MPNASHYIGVIEVLSDPKKVQTIAITCRCKHRWTEQVPGELHDSGVAMRFRCPRCATAYVIYNKILHREGVNDGSEEAINYQHHNQQFDA